MRPSVLAYMTCAVGISLLAGCPDRSISKVNPIQTGAETKVIPISADIDILFVIDDSKSTQDKQDLFTANFGNFVSALDAFPGGRPNLHIGVVTTSVGTGSDVSLSGCPKVNPTGDGLLVNTGRVMTSCQGPSGQFIIDTKNPDNSRMTNYAPSTLEQVFGCIADVGTNGCGFEAPLEAMKRALDGSKTQNAGFIRPGAYLAVIILTDEDDCSIKDPAIFALNIGSTDANQSDWRCQPLYAYKCDQSINPTAGGSYTNCTPTTGGYLQDTSAYYNFLTTVKDPAQIVVAVIGGANADGSAPPASGEDIMTGSITQPFPQNLALEPSCNTTINGNLAIARPGVRLADFVRQFGNRGTYYTVCQNDYSNALTDIGNKLFNAISPCLEGPVDDASFDPMATGQNLQCAVSDVQNLGSSGQTETQIGPCTMQAGANTIGTDTCTTGPCPASGQTFPCWYVKKNTATCSTTDTNLEIHVVRTSPPTTGTDEVVSCAVSTM